MKLLKPLPYLVASKSSCRGRKESEIDAEGMSHARLAGGNCTLTTCPIAVDQELTRGHTLSTGSTTQPLSHSVYRGPDKSVAVLDCLDVGFVRTL